MPRNACLENKKTVFPAFEKTVSVGVL